MSDDEDEKDVEAYRKETAREKILRYLDPNSENFMGSGMTMKQFSLVGYAEKTERSFARQNVGERRRRMDLMIRMAVELTKIREVNGFGTRLGESMIEDVIEGDLKGLHIFTEFFEMKDFEDVRRQEMVDLWSGFAALVKEAIAGWPLEDGEEAIRH